MLTLCSSSIVFLILDILVCIMVGFQIFMFHKRNLSAKTMLVTQTILSTYWTACMAVEALGISGAFHEDMKPLLSFPFTIADT